jgi:hypothetical protein
MNNIIYSILFVLLILGSSCKQSKVTKGGDKSDTERVEVTDGYRMIVSFFSPGNGIDRKMNQIFLNFVKESYPLATFDVVNWGREGEKDYCFKLNEFAEKDQAEFVKEVNKLIEPSSKVRVSEKTICTHKK